MIEDPELQVNGFVLIIDWSNFTFKQASKLTPSMLRLAIEGLQVKFFWSIFHLTDCLGFFCLKGWHYASVGSILKTRLCRTCKGRECWFKWYSDISPWAVFLLYDWTEEMSVWWTCGWLFILHLWKVESTVLIGLLVACLSLWVLSLRAWGKSFHKETAQGYKNGCMCCSVWSIHLMSPLWWYKVISKRGNGIIRWWFESSGLFKIFRGVHTEGIRQKNTKEELCKGLRRFTVQS